MGKVTEILVNLLTLGIPAIVKAIQESVKAADEYWYTAKKKGGCKHFKRCCYGCHCMETIEDCKRLHCRHEE